jgi:hypothetical protein
MARIEGLKGKQASLVSRVLFKVAERRLGKVSEMWEICAHVPKVHLGRGMFELLLDRSWLLDRKLRRLADIKTAMVLGSPA